MLGKIEEPTAKQHQDSLNLCLQSHSIKQPKKSHMVVSKQE
jgi:hypothetical protein